MTSVQSWCELLGIEPPRIEAVKDRRDANNYALLIVALLERGAPMTLSEVAARFEEAGVAPAPRALRSLQRCKPGRPPVYRDGDRYHLDPHDHEADLWAFRLGLRPARAPRIEVVRAPPDPIPGPEVALSIAELEEAWKDATLRSWSSQRIVLAVLEAHGSPMAPAAVVRFVAAQTQWHFLRETDSAKFAHRPSAIDVVDGQWVVAPDAVAALPGARKAVRALLEKARVNAAQRPDPAVLQARSKAAERRRASHAAELAAMRRGLLWALPGERPAAVVLLDAQERTLETFVAEEVARVRERLAPFELLGAIDVRALLRRLEFDPAERHLAELGPPQKTKKLNRRGRTLKITPELLIGGSCGISRPFGDLARIEGYLAEGQQGKLRRRLEANVKSLFALYQYGRLHGTVRLRWGFLDERIPAPWLHWDEPTLHHLKEEARAAGVPLDIVVGNAPGWTEPWARAQQVIVAADPRGWGTCLVDDRGLLVDEDEIQLARLSGSG